MTTSRSVGVVTFRVSALFIAVLLRVFWLPVCFPWLSFLPAGNRGVGSWLQETCGSVPAIRWLRRWVGVRRDGGGAEPPGGGRSNRRAQALLGALIWRGGSWRRGRQVR